MSPLLPERLALALYPDRLNWLLLSGWRPRLQARGALSFGHDSQAMIEAIELTLKELAKGTRVSIVLSNRLMRYACVANPDAARNAHERRLLARHHFVRTHGAIAEQWEITLSHAALGKSALASAVDSALMVAVRAAIKRRHLRLVSLQPYLMAAFNAQMRGICKPTGMFAVAEPGRLCTIVWRDGGWETVQQAHLQHEATEEQGLQTRLRSMTGLQDAVPFHLCAPEFATFKVDGVTACPLPFLPGMSPVRDRNWAGAMLGAR